MFEKLQTFVQFLAFLFALGQLVFEIHEASAVGLCEHGFLDVVPFFDTRLQLVERCEKTFLETEKLTSYRRRVVSAFRLAL